MSEAVCMIQGVGLVWWSDSARQVIVVLRVISLSLDSVCRRLAATNPFYRTFSKCRWRGQMKGDISYPGLEADLPPRPARESTSSYVQSSSSFPNEYYIFDCCDNARNPGLWVFSAGFMTKRPTLNDLDRLSAHRANDSDRLRWYQCHARTSWWFSDDLITIMRTQVVENTWVAALIICCVISQDKLVFKNWSSIWHLQMKWVFGAFAVEYRYTHVNTVTCDHQLFIAPT